MPATPVEVVGAARLAPHADQLSRSTSRRASARASNPLRRTIGARVSGWPASASRHWRWSSSAICARRTNDVTLTSDDRCGVSLIVIAVHGCGAGITVKTHVRAVREALILRHGSRSWRRFGAVATWSLMVLWLLCEIMGQKETEALYHCPDCECGFTGYHRCPDGPDRVQHWCSDCDDLVYREAHQMDIEGIAPGRCTQCTLDRMAEP